MKFLVIFITLISPSIVFSEEIEDIGKKTSELIEKGKLDQAIELLENNEGNSRILNNKATALYRKGDFTNAASFFKLAAKKAGNSDIKLNSLFNLGNSLAQSKKYKEAIDSYNEALKIGEDEEVKKNLEFVKKLLDQQEQKKEKVEKNKDQQKKDSEKQKQEQDNQDKEKEEKNKDSDSKKDNKDGSSEKKPSDQNSGGKKQNEDQTDNQKGKPKIDEELEKKRNKDSEPKKEENEGNKEEENKKELEKNDSEDIEEKDDSKKKEENKDRETQQKEGNDQEQEENQGESGNSGAQLNEEVSQEELEKRKIRFLLNNIKENRRNLLKYRALKAAKQLESMNRDIPKQDW